MLDVTKIVVLYLGYL